MLESSAGQKGLVHECLFISAGLNSLQPMLGLLHLGLESYSLPHMLGLLHLGLESYSAWNFNMSIYCAMEINANNIFPTKGNPHPKWQPFIMMNVFQFLLTCKYNTLNKKMAVYKMTHLVQLKKTQLPQELLIIGSNSTVSERAAKNKNKTILFSHSNLEGVKYSEHFLLKRPSSKWEMTSYNSVNKCPPFNCRIAVVR